MRTRVRQQRNGARHQLPRALTRYDHKGELAVWSLIENGHSLGTSKGLKNVAKPFVTIPPPAAGGHNDGSQFVAGPLQIVVHDHKIVFCRTRYLLPRTFQAPSYRFIGILAAGAQAALQVLPRRRNNENSDCLRQFLFHLPRALHVDLEYQVESCLVRIVHLLLRRAVPVPAEYLRVFEELAGVNAALEFGFRNEIITFPRTFRYGDVAESWMKLRRSGPAAPGASRRASTYRNRMDPKQ